MELRRQEIQCREVA